MGFSFATLLFILIPKIMKNYAKNKKNLYKSGIFVP